MVSGPSDSVDWRSVALVVLSGIVAALNVGKVAPALPALIAEMDLSLVVAGWLVAGISATAALLGLLMGRLVDRFGAHKMLLTGLLFSAAGSLVGVFASAWPFLLFTRLLEGVGLLWVVVAAPTLLAQRLQPQLRARVMGWWGCFMPAGTGLSIFIAPILLPAVEWRGLWLLIALLSFATAYLVHRYLPADSQQLTSASAPVGGLRRVLCTPGLYCVGLCFGLYSFQYSAILQFIPLWLGEQYGLSLLAASLIAVLYCVGNIAGNLLGGRLLQLGFSSPRLLLLCSLAMAALALPIFYEAFPPLLRLLALITFPLVGGVIPSSAFAMVPQLAPAPHLIASSNGLVVQLLNAGMFLGAPVQALAVSNFGWSAATWVLVPAALLSALLAWVLGWQQRGLASAVESRG